MDFAVWPSFASFSISGPAFRFRDMKGVAFTDGITASAG